MLRECTEVRQPPGEGHRRWFIDPDFELIVWYGLESDPLKITGFQLCYDRRIHQEHALTWRLTGGVGHHAIDDGGSPWVQRSPVLVPDGPIPAVSLRDRFAAVARDLDPTISSLVQQVLHELAAKALAPVDDGQH